MAFKKNSSLMRHDAAGAAAFWARWYLERENWVAGNKDPKVRIKVSADDEEMEEIEVAVDDPHPRHH